MHAPQIANPEPAESSALAPAAQRGNSTELAQRLAQQRAQAAEFRRHYDGQLAALEQMCGQRLDEIEQQVRRRAEADYLFAADDLSRQRRRLKKKEARLEAEADRLELRRTRTKLQRRRLAAYFRLQRRQLRNQERTEQDDTRHQALTAERDALALRLTEALRQLEASNATHADDTHQAEIDQLQSRLERALNDVRDLKRRNGELEQQYTPPAKNAASGGLDWESQKRRMLAALEADEHNSDDAARTQERLTIDGTIRITDTVVQEKDREILELQERLEQQAPSSVLLPSVAAMAEIFDRDEGIRRERDRLKQLEDQWQSKLRQAEIDLSMERAKHARQQAELEELRRLHNRAHEQPAEASEPKPPIRGRWLARLGLKEGDYG